MKTFITDCKHLKSIDKPASYQEFYKHRDECLIIKQGITNPHAKKLSFNTAKQLLDNEEVKLHNSLEDDDFVVCTDLHSYLDYCSKEIPLEANYYFNSSGKTGRKTFTNEPIYMIGKNVCHDENLKQYVTCPEYLGDWFDKYLPKYRDYIVYGKMHTWFFIGPKNTKSEMHSDHDAIHTTIQQLDGVKRFFIISSEDMIKINKEQEEGYFHTIEFELTDDKKCKIIDFSGERDLSILQNINISYGDLSPGDLIYLPESCGHYAKSLTPSFSVSRDFIDERNIDRYLVSILAVGALSRGSLHFFSDYSQEKFENIYHELSNIT